MSTEEVAKGTPYIRRSSREGTSKVWEVRRNRPDQTFEILSVHASEAEAKLAACMLKRAEVFEALLSEFIYVAEPPNPADSLAGWRKRWQFAS